MPQPPPGPEPKTDLEAEPEPEAETDLEPQPELQTPTAEEEPVGQARDDIEAERQDDELESADGAPAAADGDAALDDEVDTAEPEDDSVSLEEAAADIYDAEPAPEEQLAEPEWAPGQAPAELEEPLAGEPEGEPDEAEEPKKEFEDPREVVAAARRKLEEMEKADEEAKAQAEPEPQKQEPGPASSRARLLDYLHQLTDHLPASRRSDFNVSGNRLKIAYLQAKLAGRPGLRRKLGSKPPQAPKPVAYNRGSVANAFSYLQGLAKHHPNRDVGLSLERRVGEVVRRLHGGGRGGEDQNG